MTLGWRAWGGPSLARRVRVERPATGVPGHPASGANMMDSMQTVLIVIHLLVVLALIGVVLIQRSEGGGLGVGGGGGSGGFFTARGSANVLTRATAILALLFFITSLALTIVAGWGRAPRSILAPASQGQSVPAGPQGGTILDQIRPPTADGAQAPASTPAPAAPSGPQVPQSQ